MRLPAFGRWEGVIVSLVVLAIAATASAAEQVPAAAERWSAAGDGGTPQFERHVVPVLGKLGCNNRACHGSFQGQKGFRLSLFGHDPQMDYTELVKEQRETDKGTRVDLKRPEKSVALLKPLGQVDHGGGKRLEAGSWQHRLLREWLAAGAPFDPEKESKLQRLQVRPAEIQLKPESERQVPLEALAHFSDGTIEDVTALTLYSSNDKSVARVSSEGLVSAAGSGDTAVVATYGGAVVTSQVIVPVPGDGKPFPEFPPNNKADELVLAKLKKVGIRPSGLSSDEVFLRRVYLDVIGTLPTPAEARRFLNDPSPDKRKRLIDELLARPEYGMYWATKFSDWTGNDNRFTPQPRAKTAWLWHNWLRDKLDRNVPYDEIAGGIITATTREGRPLDEVVKEYKTVSGNLEKGFDDGTYASRKTNDIFWQKATNRRPESAALQTAYAFLGIRLQCARCHKHPFDRWTQADFEGFTSFFAVVDRGVPDDVPKELKKKRARNSYRYSEVYVNLSGRYRKRLKRTPPKLLGGQTVSVEEGDDPRVALLEWLRAPDNPYFAAAIVNRLWGHYLGVGIVNPVDDFNAANPPSNPQLLEWLSRDFIEHGFNLKHLHRRILNSRTYQLSWRPNDSNRLDERNFSHALLKRMPAEVVLDAVNQVTGAWENYRSSNAPDGTRTINLAVTRLRNDGPEYELTIFGRPLRTQTCDCERSGETGLAQALYLLNDASVNRKIARPKGRLGALLKEIPEDDKLIEELYLAVLSRYPTEAELQKSVAYVAESASREAGMQDILWSLINLREFIFIH